MEKGPGLTLGVSTVRDDFPFAGGHGDVGEAGLGEDGSLDIINRGLDARELEIRLGDANDDDELAESPTLSLVSESKGTDNVERHPVLLEMLVDPAHNGDPAVLDRVIVGDGAQFPLAGLALGPPVRWGQTEPVL